MQNNGSIYVGYFFDGTGNNGFNVENQKMAPKSNNNSYFQAKSNIFKLFNLCTFNAVNKYYIEGVGTKTGEEDSNYAMITCFNPAGYSGYSSDDKLAVATAHFNNLIQQYPTATFELYIYGFSRGATLGRAFANQVLVNENVTINFLGLFDTVESTNILDPNKLYNVFFTESALTKINQVLHLCASHECRYYFPSTRIVPISENFTDYLSKKVKEVFVPGAHADVGGGYVIENESIYLNEVPGTLQQLKKALSIIKNTVKDASGNLVWYNLLDENVNIEYPPSTIMYLKNIASERPNPNQKDSYQVSNLLSNVYGYIMATYTNLQEGIDLDPLFRIDDSLKIDKGLKDLQDYLFSYIAENAPKQPYNYADLIQYIHLSANYGAYNNENQINLTLNVHDFKQLERDYQELLSGLDLMPYPNGANNNQWERVIITKR